jgi:hypothetical protein
MLMTLKVGAWCFHSMRKASIGLITLARRAGNQQARKATNMSAMERRKNVNGSVALMP